MVSGTISLFLSKCFSPFPHGTGSLSVSWEYLALPDGPGSFAQDFTCPALLRIPLCRFVLRIRGFHPLRPLFPGEFSSHARYNGAVLQPRRCVATTPVWALPRSLATTGGIINLFSLPRGTKMFQFPRFASPPCAVIPAYCAGGLSHSEIRGSRVICTLPRLIAAYHVLHRLHEPRHPPCALIYFLYASARFQQGKARSPYFSCIVYMDINVHVIHHFSYSLACVNMSKISCANQAQSGE